MSDTLMIYHGENEVLKIKKKLTFFKELIELLKQSFKSSMLKKKTINLKINPLFKFLTQDNKINVITELK